MDAQDRGFAGIGEQFGGSLDPSGEQIGRYADLAHQPGDEMQDGLAQLPRDAVAVDAVARTQIRDQRGQQGAVAVPGDDVRCGRGGEPFLITRGMRRGDGIDELWWCEIGIERVPPRGRVRIGMKCFGPSPA